MIDARHAFAYDTWASRRILERLREVPSPEPELVRLFAHALIAPKVWGARIEGRDSSGIPIWPDLSLDDCERLVAENERLYREILSRSASDILEATVRYTNQHGLSYETRVRDILFHILTHGAYHRAQVARGLREAGHEPVNTDYISYVRELTGAPWKP